MEILAGAFVCEYAGEVLTEAEVEATRKKQKGDDDYLFGMDHFELLYREEVGPARCCSPHHTMRF